MANLYQPSSAQPPPPPPVAPDAPNDRPGCGHHALELLTSILLIVGLLCFGIMVLMFSGLQPGSAREPVSQAYFGTMAVALTAAVVGSILVSGSVIGFILLNRR